MDEETQGRFPAFFAHSVANEPPDAWQKLETHLLNVTNRARYIAEKFGAGEWGYLAGLLHDIGKYHADWQDFILQYTKNHDPDHTRQHNIAAFCTHPFRLVRQAIMFITKNRRYNQILCMKGKSVSYVDPQNSTRTRMGPKGHAHEQAYRKSGRRSNDFGIGVGFGPTPSRGGARQLLQAALDNEVTEYMAKMGHRQTEDGLSAARQAVARSYATAGVPNGRW